MAARLAKAGERPTEGFVKRFDPRFWTVNFPRPMMAAVTTTGPADLRVDAVFYRADDLAGLIWEAEDRHDHPLLAYGTDRDFRGLTLAFRWRSAGVRPLDTVNGPTLTIEGRDADGMPRAWYVRLWNYAEGTPEDAAIRLDFDALDGGFLLPGEADRVFAGDIDRMFVSLVAPGYTGGEALLDAPAQGWIALDGIACEGAGSVLVIGDAMVPAHGLRMATGYDDGYNLTPARIVRTIVHLGYRGPVNHYVGMSHYFRLQREPEGLFVSLGGGALNGPCAAWHRSFADAIADHGLGLILSLSYELFDAHCWGDWKQRAADGSPALTGWVPPSTLLSPAHGGAMAYLQAVARAFVGIARDAGLPVRFQVGEPWWWVRADGTICLHDASATAALGGSVPALNLRQPIDAGGRALLDRAGALLAASTAALCAAVREEAPGAETLLLAYLPTILDAAMPEARRANVPTGWATPAFDVLQIEDYDWVTAGDRGSTARGVDAMLDRLGYPIADTHYLSGFVLDGARAGIEWPRIEAAAAAARARGHAETFVWALPQLARDGFTFFETGEVAVQAFDDVDFPIAIGRGATVEPGFSTAIVTSAGGAEQRNVDWAQARMRFDAGPGVRSEADIRTLTDFFRARRGAARGFRFRDPIDSSSAAGGAAPAAGDVAIGTGDGVTTRFPLVKRYGEGAEAEARRITRPVAGSVCVAVAGTERATGWTLAEGGIVSFATAPAAGAAVTAGFRFDVPVRFAEDRLEVSLAAAAAGEAASVPMVELREAFS